VINMVTGDGQAVSQVALTHPDLAGIHFTGSTGTFQHLWRTVGENIPRYRNYPRLVGETGGKDFVIVHPSADSSTLAAILIRGAFEYQGQKCSAASRAYVAESVWTRTRDDFIAQVESLTMGDVASDLSLFMGAVIDERAFAKHAAAIDRARNTASIQILAGGMQHLADGGRGHARAQRAQVRQCQSIDAHGLIAEAQLQQAQLREVGALAHEFRVQAEGAVSGELAAQLRESVRVADNHRHA